MTTNRIKFQDKDSSFSVPLPSGVTGFFTVRAPKGTAHPTYISKGDTSAFADIFGSASAQYPGLKEALDFINSYGAYVSAPAGVHTGKTNQFGGVYLTTLGTLEPFGTGVQEDETGSPTVDFKATFTRLTGVVTTSPNPFIGGVSVVTGTTITATGFENFDPGLVSQISLTLTDGTDTVTEVFTLGGGDVLKGVAICGTYTAVGDGYNMSIVPDATDTPALFALTDGTSPGDLTGSLSWTMNIEDKVVGAFYQTSMRNTAGTLTVKGIDLNPFVISAEESGIVFSSLTLTDSTHASFSVTSVPSTDINSYVRIAGKIIPVALASTVVTERVTNIATQITNGLNGSGWAVTNSVGVISIIATTAFLLDNTRLNSNYNTLSLAYSEPSAVPYAKSFTISFDRNKVDSQNSSLYVGDLMGSNLYLRVLPYKDLSELTESFSAQTVFLQGKRIVDSSDFVMSTDLAPTLIEGWNHASDSAYEKVKLFVDPEFSQDIAPMLSSLRSTSHIFSTFITGIRVPNAVAVSKTDANAVVKALKLKRSGYPMITGLAYYVNEMEVSANSQSFWTIPVGAMAVNCAKIIEDWQGGRSPSWTMEQNVGGVLAVSANRQKYNFDKDMVDELDLAGMNPIVKSIDFGIMAMSDKTAQDPNNVTDWSYLGHSMAFDLFKEEIRTTCMIPQIKKPIDEEHFALRESQASIILSKRLVGARKIWEDGVIDVRGVNTDETKAQKNFYIKARVKVSPFSDYVTLILENIAQTQSV